MSSRINVGYFVAEGCRSIVSHGLMSFAAVCMIVACLIIMGSFSLVAVNADQMLGQLENENEFLAYIDEDLSDNETSALMSEIEQIDNVATVTFISKEQAKANYLQGHDYGLYQSLPDEVFRDRFAIHVADLEQFSQTVEAVAALDGIANYRAESDIADGFVMIRNVASALATILVTILVIISLFIIANTIKLATFTRREEIAIMKMCGATNWFIRWPFVVEGLVLGVTGAVVAFFLQWVIYTAIYTAIADSGALTLFALIPFRTLAWRVLGVFALAGVVIGAGGSVLAIRKFLQV
jgi:cell division transport system permease protein